MLSFLLNPTAKRSYMKSDPSHQYLFYALCVCFCFVFIHVFCFHFLLKHQLWMGFRNVWDCFKIVSISCNLWFCIGISDTLSIRMVTVWLRSSFGRGIMLYDWTYRCDWVFNISKCSFSGVLQIWQTFNKVQTEIDMWCLILL